MLFLFIKNSDIHWLLFHRCFVIFIVIFFKKITLLGLNFSINYFIIPFPSPCFHNTTVPEWHLESKWSQVIILGDFLNHQICYQITKDIFSSLQKYDDCCFVFQFHQNFIYTCMIFDIH